MDYTLYPRIIYYNIMHAKLPLVVTVVGVISNSHKPTAEGQ